MQVGLMPYNYVCVHTGVLMSQLSSMSDMMSWATLAQLSLVALVALLPGLVMKNKKKHALTWSPCELSYLLQKMQISIHFRAIFVFDYHRQSYLIIHFEDIENGKFYIINFVCIIWKKCRIIRFWKKRNIFLHFFVGYKEICANFSIKMQHAY